MAVIQITDHVARAVSRFMQQYKSKANLKDLVEVIYGERAQGVEDALFTLFGRLNIENSVGDQLDGIGRIVGQARLGFDDVQYRVLLLARIGRNVSNGEPERIISVLKLLTGADFVHYINVGGAELILETDGTVDPTLETLIFEAMGGTVAGGVRLNRITEYEKDEAFAFAGNNADAAALGFDDGTGTTGGKFASQVTFDPPFAFAGSDVDPGGFGAGSVDPLVGGVFTE